jgi:hypothetical protein
MAGEDTPVTVLNNVEIFRVGRWRGNKTVEATPALLDQIVGNFHQLNAKVSGYGVPVKLGHSDAVGAPAFGWMSDLQRVGDVLVADFSDVDPAIVDAIGKRRYNSVSIELYPVVNYSGKIFENVLGGVALLGAEWPAVKGLKPLSGSLFSENEEKLVLSDKEMEDVKTFTETEHDTLMADAVVKATSDLSAKLAASEARASTAEAAVKAFREDADKASVAAIIEAADERRIRCRSRSENPLRAGDVIQCRSLPDEKFESFVASGDLSLLQNRLVCLLVNANFKVGAAGASNALAPYGVLSNAPRDGENASVVRVASRWSASALRCRPVRRPLPPLPAGRLPPCRVPKRPRTSSASLSRARPAVCSRPSRSTVRSCPTRSPNRPNTWFKRRIQCLCLRVATFISTRCCPTSWSVVAPRVASCRIWCRS